MRTSWLNKAVYFDDSGRLPLPKGVEFIWRIRAGLEKYDCSTVQGRFELYVWWMEHGRHDYPTFDWTLSEEDQVFLFANRGRELPLALRMYASARPYLQTMMDDTAFGIERYLLWWCSDDQLEPFAVATADMVVAHLSSLSPETGGGPLAVPPLVECLQRVDEGLSAFDCVTEQGRFDLYVWWVEHGCRAYPSFEWTLSESDQSYLFANHDRELPLALRLYARTRPYLQAVAGNAELGFERYLLWWCGDGMSEPFVAATADMMASHLTSLPGTDRGLLALPPLIACLQRVDKGLSKFDASTIQGRFDLYVWWVVHGRRERPKLRWSLDSTDHDALFGRRDGELPLALTLYASRRPDLKALVEAGEQGCDRYVLWWFGDGQGEPFVAETRDALCRSMTEFDGVPVPLPAIWRLRPDLQQAYDLTTDRDRANLLTWWRNFGTVEYPGVSLCAMDFSSSHEESVETEPTTPQPVAGQDGAGIVWQRGVNVVGFAAGVLGIGEDARMATAVTHAAGFEAAALQPNLLWMPRSSSDFDVGNALGYEKYPVSLFCLPPTEMIRLVLEGSGALIESPTYKIGAWPWELPNWPATFNGVVNLVDEIWAQSKFVAKSYAPLASLAPVEIHHVPLAVEIPAPTQNVRARYGLPANDFLFYVMFDGNSWLTRKNPLAGVTAFQKAFEKEQGSGVGLVIKAMNIRPGQPMWEEIVKIAARDARVHVITDTLSRQDVINLMASCDAYISLHRSEGFGRVIAEAMLLGQPTVATNFSGNVDFCTSDTCFLVDGELTPLTAGDYIFADGQYWCNPEIDIAAERLREVLEDDDKRRERAAAGKNMIESHFSRAAISRVYQKRLASVFDKLGVR
ncbi:glycosyltransferase family 4 protein [Burkholderia ubonensis]|uniref:glycosyltransferase family 4 protein n=1 Tax=Burkholderia ubonensis TaxID=101571 RepID=UPI000B211F98|nr:glycosyltransferase [Burkholderia ubonensis]